MLRSMITGLLNHPIGRFSKMVQALVTDTTVEHLSADDEDRVLGRSRHQQKLIKKGWSISEENIRAQEKR